ncbi:lysophospholipid acyltransferase family protein [Pilimelia columellifera]|uniref:Lysophospholipid acyltransferase family protein n=1 Tax=Pilimelia columellifera subsp. columellifera TaxID=706583 RepID=A0ABN3NQB1_9ACTN
MTVVSRWRPPRLWRASLWLAGVVVAVFARLRVSGGLPPGWSGGPLLLAANHLGLADPVVLAAAARRLGVAPRVMATAGVFRAPVLGWFMRSCGHVRVDRRPGAAAAAVDAAAVALRGGSVLLVYPEGRIGLDPGLWPERGKTGVARLALTLGVPVVPVAQWGAQELLPYGAPRRVVRTLLRALWRRPVARVWFGPPVDLSGLSLSVTGDAARATERIMDAVTAGLVPLRAGEPQGPRWVDPTRPVTSERSRQAPVHRR